MATLNVTFAFLADVQSFNQLTGLNSTLSWDNTVGNPVGSLKSIIAGTAITAGSLDSRCTAFASGTGCTSGMATLADGAITATLSNQRAFSATDASFVTTTGTNLTGLALPSSNSVTLTIRNHLGTTSGGSGKGVTLYQDNLNFTLTYIPAVARGVTPLIGGHSQGTIGRVGPMRPGMSRFKDPRRIPQRPPQPPNPSTSYTLTADAGIFVETGIDAALFKQAQTSSQGVRSRVGWRSSGSIGRPGPNRPGLSRFWQYPWRNQNRSGYAIQGDPGSFVATGTDADLSTNRVNATGGVVQAFRTIASAVQSSRSVLPRPTWTSPGEIGRPGPGLPGLSRLHPAIAFRAGNTSTAYALTADSGSFALAGNAATLAQGVNPGARGVAHPINDGATATPILSSRGVRTRTGWASRSKIGRPGPGLPGLSRLWRLKVPASRSGTNPTATASILTADAGVFVATGIATPGGGADHSIIALPGAFLVNIPTEPPVSLTAQRNLTASVGSFALTGHAASLIQNQNITASSGPFFFTGLDVDLAVGYHITASAGVFVATGTAATLTYSTGTAGFGGGGVRPRIGWKASGSIGRPGPNRPGLSRFWQRFKWSPLRIPSTAVDYPLTASAGAFTWTGTAAGLAHGHKITASAGSFVETGTAATLTYSASTALGGVHQPFAFVVTSLRSALGVLSRPGWRSAGEIGRPGPGLPGLSRFWHLPARQPVNVVLTNPTLTADAGVFVVTGTAAGLTASRKMTGSAGSFVLTGTAATLVAARQITASAGTFVLTGIDAALTSSHPTSVGGVRPRPTWTSPGEIGRPGPLIPGLTRFWQRAWRNQTAHALTSYTLTADAGVFVETGISAALTATRTLTASAGSFTETGTAAPLTAQRTITASVGSFTLTGTAVAFKATRKLTASAGSFVLTGQPVTFTRQRGFTAAVRVYLVTGKTTTTLAYGHTITASAGSFTLTGLDVIFPSQRVLLASAGSFVLTGGAVTLARNAAIVAVAGSFTVTGATVPLVASRQIVASAGSFALTGADVSLAYGSVSVAAAGSFALTGTAAGLAQGRNITAAAGSFALTGLDATLTYGHPLTASPGVFLVAGLDVTFTPVRVLLATPGVFLVTGIATPEGPESAIEIIPDRIRLASAHIDIEAIRLARS